MNDGKLLTMYTQELHVTSNIAWCHLLPADDLAPGEKQLQDVRFKALSWSLLETAVRPQKKERNMEDCKFECHISRISSCYYFKL